MSATGDQLKNVFWLGGSPCAGKSSISEILASRFDLDVYHVDEAFETHVQSLDAVHQPALAKWCASSWNERWMQPIDNLLQDVIACYQEHFALVRTDILGRSRQKSLLVEGTALLPRQVVGLLSNTNQAIWITPSEGFQREHYAKRVWAREIVDQCSNPEVAFQNWMERDIRFAKWIEAEVTTLNLPQFKIDGSRTIAESAERVAAHFELIAECRE